MKVALKHKRVVVLMDGLIEAKKFMGTSRVIDGELTWSPTVTISGTIKNNTFTADATDDSYAFYVLAQSSTTVNLNGEIQNNNLSTNSSTGGITEEFYLENDLSTINVPEITGETELSENNNDAQVTTSGTINWG